MFHRQLDMAWVEKYFPQWCFYEKKEVKEICTRIHKLVKDKYTETQYKGNKIVVVKRKYFLKALDKLDEEMFGWNKREVDYNKRSQAAKLLFNDLEIGSVMRNGEHFHMLKRIDSKGKWIR